MQHIDRAANGFISTFPLLGHRRHLDEAEWSAAIGYNIVKIHTLRELCGIDIAAGRKAEETITAIAIIEL